jgi:hypothetical protein
MIDVRGLHQPVHRRVDGRRRTALAVQAVVEGGNHLVLALQARIHTLERPQPVQPQHGQPCLGKRPEVTAGPLHPHQLDVTTGDGIGASALRGGVATGVVGVTGISAQPTGPCEEGVGFGVGCHELSVLTQERVSECL